MNPLAIDIYTEAFPVEYTGDEPLFAVYFHTTANAKMSADEAEQGRAYLCPWEWPSTVSLFALGLTKSGTNDPDKDEGLPLTIEEVDPVTLPACVQAAQKHFTQLVSIARANKDYANFFEGPTVGANVELKNTFVGTTWFAYFKQFIHAPAPLPQALQLVKFVRVKKPLPPDITAKDGWIRILPQFPGAPVSTTGKPLNAPFSVTIAADQVTLRYPQTKVSPWLRLPPLPNPDAPSFVQWRDTTQAPLSTPGAPENLQIPLFNVPGPLDPLDDQRFNQIQGFGALVRPAGDPEWTNLNLAQVTFQGDSSVTAPLGVTFIPVPWTKLTRVGTGNALSGTTVYHNSPGHGENIPLGALDSDSGLPFPGVDQSPFPALLIYKKAYPDVAQLPCILYGQSSEVYTFPIGHCGDVPLAMRGNKIWSVNNNPLALRTKNTGKLLRTNFPLPQIRLSSSTDARQTWPSVPVEVEPLAHSRLDSDYSGLPLILLKPLNDPSFTDAVPGDVTLYITPPIISLPIWERCGLINRQGIDVDAYNAQWETAIDRWYGLNDENHPAGMGMRDPSLVAIEYRKWQVWPTLEVPPLSFQQIGPALNPRIESIGGVDPCEVPLKIAPTASERAIVYAYEIRGRFHDGEKVVADSSIKSIKFLVEIASADAVTGKEIDLKASPPSLTTVTGFEWQASPKIPAVASRWQLYSQCQFDYLRWSWNGQPLHWPPGPVVGSTNGIPFNVADNPPPEALIQLFPAENGAIKSLEFNVRNMGLDSGSAFHSPVQDIKPGGLFYVGRATLFHRYRGLLTPQGRGTCDFISCDPITHVEKCRFTGTVPPPRIALVLPTTLTGDDTVSGTDPCNPGFFIIHNEECYRPELTGLAERFEIECAQVTAPGTTESFFELAPDPVLDQTSTPLAGLDITILQPEGAIGLTNENVASGITYPRCAFFVPAPTVKDPESNPSGRNSEPIWWYFYHLRFRRVLPAAWMATGNGQDQVSEWSQPIWTQILPPSDWTLAEDGNLYPWSELVVSPKGTFTLASTPTQAVALAPTPSENNCHALYLLVTRAAIDNLFGKKSEIFVDFIPYDKNRLADIAGDYFRIVEVQEIPDSKLKPIDAGSLQSRLFDPANAYPPSRITRIGQRLIPSTPVSAPQPLRARAAEPTRTRPARKPTKLKTRPAKSSR